MFHRSRVHVEPMTYLYECEVRLSHRACWLLASVSPINTIGFQSSGMCATPRVLGLLSVNASMRAWPWIRATRTRSGPATLSSDGDQQV
jgi:hypothetical protein